MSDLDLYADLFTRRLVSRDGGAVALPTLVLGDSLRCTLRTFERSEGGDLRERDLRVRTLRASMGSVLAAPTSGWFKLGIGDTETSEIPFDANAEAFKAAAQSAGIIDSVETPATGTWVVKTTRPDTAGDWPIFVHANKLAPESFIRVRQFKQLGLWWFECRLIQTPLAFNNGHERVLPVPPTVRRIREGRTGSETEPAVNEIQALHLPPDFRGTYFLRWNFRVSKLLGIEDGPDEIAAALNAMFASGKRFEVTNPEPDHAYAEFIGELEGSPQPLITVQVNTFAPGVLTFELPLDRAPMAAALRAVTEIEVPFELELEIVEDGEDVADPAVPGRCLTIFQQPVKIVREQIWEELALVQAIDWLRPPQPREYIAFTPDQIITGSQHYLAVIGDGTSRSFALAHMLGTEAVHATIRENVSGGRRLRDDEFVVAFTSGNEVTLDFPTAEAPPALNALAVVLTAAGPKSAFQAHHHTIPQVDGLEDVLETFGARIGAIEELLPRINPAARIGADPNKALEIEIPDHAELFPGKFAADFNAGTAANDGKNLPKPAGLLPAIHDASIESILVPLPPATAHEGQVFLNDSGAAVFIPGGLGRRGQALEAGGFAGSDGRVWYRLARAGDTNSFYPSDFERELFMLHISEEMLRAGTSFSLEFKLALRLFNASTRAQFVLRIDVGSAPGQADPSPTGENLEDVTWLGTPLLSQRIILSGLKITHRFGCAIRRASNGALHADRMAYGNWTAAGQAPDSPNFTLRARLIEFDTENSVRGAKGTVSYALSDAKAEIK